MWTNFLLFLANQYVHKKGKKCRLLIFSRVSVKQTDINGECVFNKLITGYFFLYMKKDISVWDPSEQLSQNEASHLYYITSLIATLVPPGASKEEHPQCCYSRLKRPASEFWNKRCSLEHTFSLSVLGGAWMGSF